jgi:hypothetical protein
MPTEPARPTRTDPWRAPLTLAVLGALLALTITGLVVWFGPFGTFVQVTLLLHTLGGLAALAPVGWYGWRHWRHYRRHQLTQQKLVGYVTLAVLVPCMLTGLVLTWQATAQIRIGYLWRDIHRWTTVALVVLAGWHVLVLLWRDHGVAVTRSPHGLRHVALVAVACAVVPVGVAGMVALADAWRHEPARFAADYELWQPTNPMYEANRPFAPSLARTPGNAPIAAPVLAGSRGCGTAGCHDQITREWLPSAHRYAAMDKAFQAIQLTMARQNGPTSTRYCAGCHDPISLFSGTKNIATDEKALTGLHGYQEGISCLSCHSIRQTDVRGNAQYVVAPPPRYIGEIEYDTTGHTGWRLVRDFLIRAYPGEHTTALSKVMFKQPEYCAACHKQFVDEEVNKVGWVQLQNQFDNWKSSKWARTRKDPARTVECRECHMPLVESRDPAAGDSQDYNRSASDGTHRSHRFLGGNQLMPQLHDLEGGEEQTRLTHEWLQGRITVPEIAHKWPGGTVPVVSIELIAPPTARAGEPLTVQTVITSNKVGHDFPTGPLDMIQAWVEIVARDENDRVVFQSGTVDDRGFIEPGSFLFKAEPVDQFGNLIDRHNLWEMVGVRNRRSLFPGFSDTAEFTFACPTTTLRRATDMGPRTYTLESSKGRLRIDARLRYRKIDQFLLNYMRSVGFFPEFQGKALTAPITDIHKDSIVVEVL